MRKIDIEGFQMYVRDKEANGLHQGFCEPEETKFIKNIVLPDWICIDIGANIGYFTILMARKCKHVYSFEPEPNNFKLLVSNIGLNQLLNVNWIEVAISDNRERTKLYLCDTDHGMHRLYKSKWCNGGSIKVLTRDLDSFTLPRINLIKMDIEGAEYGALLGMVELLKRDKPLIIMEFHPLSIIEYGVDPRKVYDFIKKLGYTIRLIPNITQPLTYEELYVLTSDPSGGRNILCQ